MKDSLPSEPSASDVGAAASATTERDAARYRWLREQNWNDGPLYVIRADTVRRQPLGADCPSLLRLDEFIDAYGFIDAVVRSLVDPEGRLPDGGSER